MAAQDNTSKTVDQQVASDTLDLLDFYHRHPKFHQYFDAVLKTKSPDVIRFRGRPIRMYIWALSELDKSNKKLYKQVSYGKDPTVKREAIGEMLNKYNFNDDLGENHYLRLRNTVDSLHSQKEAEFLNSGERAEVEELHKLKEPQRTQSYLKFLNKKDGNEHDSDDFTPPTKSEVVEVIDKAVKDIESQGVIKAQQAIVKTEQVAGGFGSSLLKGLRSTVSGGASLAGRGGLSALDTAANLVGGRGASSLASTGITVARATANPFILWGIIITIIVLLLFIFPMLQKGSALFPPYEQTTTSTTTTTEDGLMSLTLRGPADCLICRILNGGETTYQVSYTYKGSSAVNVEISGSIPTDIELSKGVSEGWTIAGSSFKQTLSSVAPNTPRTLSLTFKPIPGKVDFSIQDYAVTATVIKPANTSTATNTASNALKLLPNPLPTPVSNWAQIKSQLQGQINTQASNIEIYKQAETATGVPWEVLAAKHYKEGSSAPNRSLVSGRIIGENEPDVVRAGACSSTQTEPGSAIPLNGGCGFRSLLDSAIYAGKLLQRKIGKTPESYSEIVRTLSMYNGGGNSNCYETGLPKAPYGGCPKEFYGEDDSYVMNLFDQKHAPMYIIYCADFQLCNPAQIDPRPGTLTVIRALVEQ